MCLLKHSSDEAFGKFNWKFFIPWSCASLILMARVLGMEGASAWRNEMMESYKGRVEHRRSSAIPSFLFREAPESHGFLRMSPAELLCFWDHDLSLLQGILIPKPPCGAAQPQNPMSLVMLGCPVWPPAASPHSTHPLQVLCQVGMPGGYSREFQDLDSSTWSLHVL